MPTQDFSNIDGRQLASQTRNVVDQLKQQLSGPKKQQAQVLDALVDRVEVVSSGTPSGSSSQNPVFSGMQGQALAIQARHIWTQLKQDVSPEQRASFEPLISTCADRVEYATTGSSMSGSQDGY